MTAWSPKAGARLKLLVRGAGLSQPEFAAAIGVSRTTLHRFFDGTDPGEELIERMLAALKVEAGELLTGTPATGAGRMVTLPIYNLEVAAGPGRTTDRLHVVDEWLFPRRWAEANLPGAADLMMFTVDGDSQWPELTDGDLVAVDPRSRRPDGELHVVRVDDGLKVKRMEQDGSIIRLISRNPLYPDELIDLASESDRFEVIGRVKASVRLH